ncbi:MAG: hypothetical protein LRY46_02020 [Candidatus Pacebacteria bacterium]|nr:hypothetical protein [Candidatus Paceibacterota bacterium]
MNMRAEVFLLVIFCFSLYKSEEQAKKKGYNVTLPTGKTQVWRVPNIDIVIADKYGIIIGEIGPGKPYLPINGNKFYVWAKEKKYTGETFCIEIK